MQPLLKALAQHWHLTAAQYWHLRLLVAICLVPFLGMLYVMLIDKRTRFFAQFRRQGIAQPPRLFSGT